MRKCLVERGQQAHRAAHLDLTVCDGQIEQHGPFQIHGDADMMQALDALLRAFVEQRRMKIAGEYRPCYEIVA